jgi:hypothetical protein
LREYVEGWAGAEIVAERRERDTLAVLRAFTTARAVAVEVAEQFVAECPRVVRGKFEATEYRPASHVERGLLYPKSKHLHPPRG